MLAEELNKTLLEVARFYDQRKVGDVGFLGFRRSTDLNKLLKCLHRLIDQDILVPGESRFLDMGCADGRVNVLLSYLVKRSIGIEVDEWTLDEYAPLKNDLSSTLKEKQLPLPPDNIFLFHGDAMDGRLYDRIHATTGVSFEEFDLFYTYLTLHDEFARLIASRAKKGSLFMVYGLGKILPDFKGLKLLCPQKALGGILGLYQKK